MNVRHVREDAPSPVALRELAAAVVRRPALWWPAMVVAVRFAPRGWWRRAPFLPLPDARYWRFRMETAFGDTAAAPSEAELAEALRWSRRARAPQR